MEWPARGLHHELDGKVHVFNEQDVDEFMSGLQRSDKPEDDGDGSNDELRKKRIQKTEEEVRKLRRENDHEDKRLILRAEIVDEYSRDLRQIKSKCREWLTDLKSQFPELEASESERLDKEFIKLFNSLIDED